MGLSLRPQWSHLLIFKCNLDICHPDAHRIFPESLLTLKCGNPSAFSMFSGGSLGTCFQSPLALMTSSCSIFHSSLTLNPVLLSSLYICLPHTSISCLSTLFRPLFSFYSKRKARSGEFTTETVSTQSKTALKIKMSLAQWIMPVIPTVGDAESGESFESRNLRPV